MGEEVGWGSGVRKWNEKVECGCGGGGVEVGFGRWVRRWSEVECGGVVSRWVRKCGVEGFRWWVRRWGGEVGWGSSGRGVPV